MYALGHKMTDKDFEVMVNEIDADGSGEIDVREFQGLLALLARTKVHVLGSC